MARSQAFDIQVINRTRSQPPVLRTLKQKTRGILKALGWSEGVLTLLLVTDREIRQYNKTYLKHDRPTDVIAFSQLEGEGPEARIENKPFLGDIVISLETTRRQARDYGNDFAYELLFYVCHGVLHLIGFDDKTKRERDRMHRIQASVLKDIGVFNRGRAS